MPTIGVAVAIPEPWASELQDYRTAVGDTTATMIPTHITLVPPVRGGRRRRSVTSRTHLADVARRGASRSAVHLRGTGTFRPVSPVVFVSLVEGISQCEQLADGRAPRPARDRPGLPVPPARDRRPPPRRRPPRPRLRRAGRLRVRVRRVELPPLRPRRGRGLAAHPRVRAAVAASAARTGTAEWRRSRSGSPRASPRCAAVVRFVDHLVRMQEHYGEVKASQQAGAVTYFGFLSFFPILALAFFVVGYVSHRLPRGQPRPAPTPSTACCPACIGNGEGQIPLSAVQTFSGLAGVIGLLGVLYSGLGWLSALRDALIVVFEKPAARAAQLRLRQAARPAHPGAHRHRPARRGGGDRLRQRGSALRPGPRRPRRGAGAGWSSSSRSSSVSWPTRCSSSRSSSCSARPHAPRTVGVAGRAARRPRLRGPQAGLDVPARRHQGPAGLPGLRHRADPAGLDQLLLPGRPLRRRLHPLLAGRYAASRADAGRRGRHRRRRPPPRCSPRPRPPADRRGAHADEPARSALAGWTSFVGPHRRALLPTTWARPPPPRPSQARGSSRRTAVTTPARWPWARPAARPAWPRAGRCSKETHLVKTRAQARLVPGRRGRLELRHLVRPSPEPLRRPRRRRGPPARLLDRPLGADRRQPGPRRHLRPLGAKVLKGAAADRREHTLH